MKCRILVVEDSATQAEALRELLVAAGHQAVVARSGEAALERLVEAPFDLVLSDVVMPGMSGYDLCRRVKASPATRAVPVVLLTSLGDPMDIVRGLEAGADNYITKPYQADHLLARVGHVLANRRLRTTSRTSMGVTVSFMGRELTVTSDKEQIIDLLLSSIEDVIRTNRALEESRRALEEAHVALEAYARERAVEARASTERYRTLMQSAGDAIFAIDADGLILEANPRAEELLGRPLREIIGTPIDALVVEEEHAASRQNFADLLRAGKIEPVARTLLRADGARVHCEITASRADTGAERLVICIVRDVSERHEAEERLRASERRLAEAQHIARLGSWEWEAETDHLEWSDELYQICGVDPAKRTLRYSQEVGVLWPEDQVRLTRALEAVVRDGGAFELECRLLPEEAGARVLLVHGQRVEGVPGAPDRVIGTAQDITTRREAERRLQESEEHYRSLFLYNPDAVYSLDAAGNFTSANPACSRLLGFRTSELLGVPMAPMIVPEDEARVREHFARALAGEAQVYQAAIRSKEGRRIELSVTNSPIVVDQQIVGVYGIAEDITVRMETEAALRRSEARFSGIIALASEAIISMDADHRVVLFNHGAERIFGYAAAEVLGRPMEMLLPERFRAEHRELMREFACSGATSRRMGERSGVHAVRRDGEEFPAEATISRLTLGDEQILTVVLRDVSDRIRAEEALRRSEEQLRQSQKMEAIGQLAGGIAHDFNNLLTVIKGNAQMLLADVGGDDPLRGDLEEINESVDRAANLTRQLLTFSRKQVTEPRVLSLNGVISHAEKLLRRVLGETVEFVTRLESRLPAVRVDPGQMEQVLMNLAVNARDAMPGGGRLLVETRLLELEQPRGGLPEPVEAGTYVVLRVADTGVGMPREVQEKVFEPFFTTKPQGQGTGLGMSTVYGIVKQSGGVIQLHSERGKGTTLEIFLPCAGGEVVSAAPAVAEPSAGRRSETILLVEDEPQVRSIARRILERYGYTVLVAGAGDEALHLIDRRESPIHLLITDVVMPGIGGPRVAERARERFPEIRVLFMSGYTDDAISQQGALAPGVEFLHKPFSPETLARRVREVIDG